MTCKIANVMKSRGVRKGDAVTIKTGGPTYSGIILKVDPTKTPKTFDTTSYDGATKTKIQLEATPVPCMSNAPFPTMMKALSCCRPACSQTKCPEGQPTRSGAVAFSAA